MEDVIEGLIRVALLLAYIWAISFLPDIRRVFAYHGAEHMTIHAFEHGDPLDPAHVEPYPTAHPLSSPQLCRSSVLSPQFTS